MQSNSPDTSTPGRLLELLSERMGLELIGTRREAALSAIRSAMAESRIETLEEYYTRITQEEKDLDRLIDAVSVGETYFFREPLQFDFLRENIVYELQRTRGAEQPIRVWSAGCASGEEAYSIAIILEEMGVDPRSKVLGTDISKSAIAQARAARYRAWSLRTASGDFMNRYFSLEGLTYQLCRRVRERAVFEQHSLTSPAVPALLIGQPCDVIFLRNVLIYFSRETVHAIVERMISCLVPGGWLITASCDPPIQGIDDLETVASNGCVFYRRRSRVPWSSGTTDRRVPAEPGSDAPPDAITAAATQTIAAAPAPTPPTEHPAAASPFDAGPAQSAMRMGDYVEVLRLAAERPDDAAAKAFTIRATANLTGSVAAYRECERACRDHPLSVELHYLLGLFLADLGRSADAADAFRRVVYLDPSLALGHFSLATILASAGDTERAVRAYRNAHRLCARMNPAEIVPLTEDEPAAGLAAAAKARIDTLVPSVSPTKGRSR